jgi:hypothetical protein
VWFDFCGKAKQACVALECGEGGQYVCCQGRRGFYGRLVLSRVLKIAFGKMVWSSFKWLLSIASAWM